MIQKKIKKKVSTEDLAQMIARGFGNSDKKFEGMITDLDTKLSNQIIDLDEKLSGKINDLDEKISGKINGLSNRIDDLALNRATREEIKILSIRVENIEHKVGIKNK
ncbi:MAG: hypothetical protein AAB534_02260 [Patescibacteria group bacterium]